MNPLLLIGGIALVGALIAMQDNGDGDGDTYSGTPYDPNAPTQPYDPDTNRMASLPGRTA
jgi:hypothetical protein